MDEMDDFEELKAYELLDTLSRLAEQMNQAAEETAAMTKAIRADNETRQLEHWWQL
jgi:hypothetical protein